MQLAPRPQSTKYVFVTGGVVSSLGKGLAAASLGRLLRSRAAADGNSTAFTEGGLPPLRPDRRSYPTQTS